jgi:hypothetical protein
LGGREIDAAAPEQGIHPSGPGGGLFPLATAAGRKILCRYASRATPLRIDFKKEYLRYASSFSAPDNVMNPHAPAKPEPLYFFDPSLAGYLRG